ncbi:hypothetical protein F511_41263 [Dorcoceras hygrometricum]|uniref:Uncharacterized protein n=1 Tax=Dorcoceras hygrometricum TaxID=472368 RepID=A0A2Z7A7A4_9LAMI|nr:hypothetical protein F511_41263 [Dorcoceras hygrometricum]
MEEPESPLQILTPCSGGRSGRRQSSNPNSPEFEFWMIRNPSFPQPNLLSADELFSDGFLLPLHKLNLSNEPPPLPSHQKPGESDVLGEESSTVESPAELSASPRLTSSKRWMDIFKKSSRVDGNGKEKSVSDSKEKRREQNNGVSASNGFSSSELNINIWPFSRSRSAGNSRRSAAATRKVSSAPCSRSNSAGESKSRKWPSSPSRAAGVHLGRSSPVWQVRRGGGSGGGVAPSVRTSDAILKSARKGIRKDGNDGRRKSPVTGSSGGGDKARVLSFNVPMCIGYRQHLGCRNEHNGSHGVPAGSGGSGDVAGEGVRGINLFNIRSLFTKKVH